MVHQMGIFNTVILSPGNKTVILPNGALSTGVITNYTTHGNLRVDLSIAVDPGMNLDKVREVATAAMLSHPKVLKSPAPEVSVLKVADGMVTLAIRPYTTQPDYWDVYFGVQELVKNAFDTHEIAGPVPHSIIISKSAWAFLCDAGGCPMHWAALFILYLHRLSPLAGVPAGLLGNIHYFYALTAHTS